ncbi:HdeD family acid-resistance protein [Maribellus maritimus]|uniref:HdeD family acid-resistance protein n=1 Tax=Maribellus maritimus TaxID=2870838 RepID=UPI001EEB4AE9|nr:DUF308 domain-containing protein [Maribellus maritimus]MCG6187106.1 DUF308 domain-containing protein [Maribellus maritimus]
MFKRYFININGFLAIVFGLVAILFPGITLAALGVYFAFTILVGGIATVAGAVRLRKNNSRWYLLLPEGIIGLLLGVLILSKPELVATLLVAIIGIWALVIGAILMFSFFRNRNAGFTNTIMLLVGILSVVTGGIIVLNPFESTRMITVLIGIYALIYGLFSIINTSKFRQN